MTRSWTRAAVPPTRLTAAQACELAAAALGGGDAAAGRRAEPVWAEGGVHWLVSTVAIGSGATVRIDDRDGAVVATGRWGVR